MKNDRLIIEAKTYIEGDKTVAETAKQLGISKRTLQLHLNKIKEIDLSLYKLVRQKQQKKMAEGRVLGGKNGKRGPSSTKEEVLSLANLIIKNQFTYEEAEANTNIPSSTIYDLLHSSYIDEKTKIGLFLVAEANHKNQTIEEYSKQIGKKR